MKRIANLQNTINFALFALAILSLAAIASDFDVVNGDGIIVEPALVYAANGLDVGS